MKTNLGHVPPPVLSPQPYPSYHRRQERRKAAQSAAAPDASSNISIINVEQANTSDQAEQAQIVSTVVSVEDMLETQVAEETIENSEN